jgi:carboxymethylenebutenolidase
MQYSQPDGYLAVSSTGVGSGVLILHAWWGLNDTMKAVCRQLAESGFIAFSPDLYHGKVADNIPEAETLGKSLDSNHLQAEAEVVEAAMFLNERAGQSKHGLAVIGFSLGAYYAVNLSVALPEHIRSVVLFYGTGPADFSKSSAAYLGHFAENDPYEPRSYADEMEQDLKRAGRSVTYYVYEGTKHWFFEPDRIESYDQAAADLAWKRTLAFLSRSPTLGTQPVTL